MTLDPQVKALLDQLKVLSPPPLEQMPPIQARQAYQMLEGSRRGSLEAVHQVSNQTIPGPDGEIPVRIYTPEGNGPHPALVFFHGGGWVVGDLDTHDSVCRSLTNLADCVVVSVDYRLAPEHKFPAAVEDSFTALEWTADHAEELNIDQYRIAVGGDSAGGNLSAVVSMMAKEKGAPTIVCQLLLYPATDFTAATDSLSTNADGYLLTKESMNYFRNHYLNNDDDALNFYASPYLAEDLSGLPAALVITAEYDPLRDEGEAFAERLQEAGVPVTVKRYDGMIHGFISMADRFDKGKAALNLAADTLRFYFTK
ncbi:alpha/beta hydrolase [Halobacillus sp. A5]|uniref:alpha/beta hydrolase n=1 Tax=Halobacillus sp. A5 TaxID=2880263 RepID=UPI0020A6627F|nr:alpha/beta hydrolase [Halobacillus sp. A5]MCP3029383.1 alpha/beta hydrolase [Halobacillus sp. A5]